MHRQRGITPLATVAGHSGYAHEPAWFTTAPVSAIQSAARTARLDDGQRRSLRNQRGVCLRHDGGDARRRHRSRQGQRQRRRLRARAPDRCVRRSHHRHADCMRSGTAAAAKASRHSASVAAKRSLSVSKSDNGETHGPLVSQSRRHGRRIYQHGLGYATAKRVIDAGGHAVLLDVNEDEGQAERRRPRRASHFCSDRREF